MSPLAQAAEVAVEAEPAGKAGEATWGRESAKVTEEPALGSVLPAHLQFCIRGLSQVPSLDSFPPALGWSGVSVVSGGTSDGRRGTGEDGAALSSWSTCIYKHL